MDAISIINSLNSRCKYLFDLIQKNGPISKSSLVDMTNTKLSTLNRSIRLMIDSGIITETTVGESTGGRKPVLYDINSKDFYVIGIDMSRTYTQIIVTNLKLKIIGERLLKYFFRPSCPDNILANSVKDLLMELDIDKSKIVGIGIGVVGPVMNEDLYKTFFRDILTVPVYIDNGANTAAIAEYYFGLGRGKNSISYINCGVGVRTGVISYGAVQRSINNSEDALGHMIVDINGESCSCGNLGCIESYVSIHKIVENFISRIKKDASLSSNINLENISYIDICNLAENNNECARDIILDSAIHFGAGLSNFIRLLNPQLIILSGPLILNSPLFYETCTKTALSNCHIENNSEIRFSKGGFFKDKSMAAGAAAMVIQEELKK